jgi:hypothetical protein
MYIKMKIGMDRHRDMDMDMNVKESCLIASTLDQVNPFRTKHICRCLIDL